MKKELLSVLTALVATMTGLQASAQNPEAYAVLSDSTLTFYYDTQRAAHQGATVYTVPQNSSFYSKPEWAYSYGIKRAVFDASCANYEPTSTAFWFYFLRKLESVEGLQYLNTANVTDMSNMFSTCHSLKAIDVSNFNTANVTNMYSLFCNCEALKSLDLSSFNTASVTDMFSMFCNCVSLTDINVSSFNTASVTNMTSMFSGCEALDTLDLSSFDTQNVSTLGYMFSGCFRLKAIYSNKDWNQGVEKRSSEMFSGCEVLEGAVKYDEEQVGIEMANPVTGYFTAKEVTAIDEIASGNMQQSETGAYNLSGQPVSSDYKGIVIKSGQKVLQR